LACSPNTPSRAPSPSPPYKVVSNASGVGHFCYLVGGDRVKLAARAFSMEDSQAKADIIVKGSRNPKLQPMIMEVVLALRRYGIRMVAVWKSREDGLISYTTLDPGTSTKMT